MNADLMKRNMLRYAAALTRSLVSDGVLKKGEEAVFMVRTGKKPTIEGVHGYCEAFDTLMAMHIEKFLSHKVLGKRRVSLTKACVDRNIFTLGQLVRMTRSQFGWHRNVGAKALERIDMAFLQVGVENNQLLGFGMVFTPGPKELQVLEAIPTKLVFDEQDQVAQLYPTLGDLCRESEEHLRQAFEAATGSQTAFGGFYQNYVRQLTAFHLKPHQPPKKKK